MGRTAERGERIKDKADVCMAEEGKEGILVQYVMGGGCGVV